MVYLHLEERHHHGPRPTMDIDAIIDVRGTAGLPVQRFVEGLRACGFNPVQGDPSGNQHRWMRGDAQIDILIPRFLVEGRSDGRNPRFGRVTTIQSAGAQFLIDHSIKKELTLGSRTLKINVPTFLGVIYGKCSATINKGDTRVARHYIDLLSLMSVATDDDFL